MPSVDKARNTASAGGSSSAANSMYSMSLPTSGPPPQGGGDPGVDSSMERGPPHHAMGPYGYGPYGGPPPLSYHPHHPMAPMRPGEKSSPPHSYGQYPHGVLPPQQPPPHYPGYGGGSAYMPPYGAYSGGGSGGAVGPGVRSPPWIGYDYPGYPPPSQHAIPPAPSSAVLPTAASQSSSSSPPKEQPHQRGGRSTRGGLQSSTTAAPPYSHESSQRLSAPVTPHKRSPESHGGNGDSNAGNTLSQSASSETPVQSVSQHVIADELDRAKMQAAAELSLAEVRPIQTDFHFFVQDQKPILLEAATNEVNRSLVGKSPELVRRHRLFLINSNLNCRLLKAWEDLPRDQREDYFKKEEDDRHRFMEDDEVAGRHCFTLTARIRSPSKVKSPSLEDDNNDDPEDDAATGLPGNMSPSKLIAENDSYLDDEKASKRFPDILPTKEESPSKKNKGVDKWE